MTLRVKAIPTRRPSSVRGLYHPFSKPEESETKPVDLLMIPYYSWANRSPSEMEVWLPWTSR